jgi:hypothetical protein
VDECKPLIDGICDKHQVEKIETIGDAYLAATGCTASPEGICVRGRGSHSFHFPLNFIIFGTHPRFDQRHMGDKVSLQLELTLPLSAQLKLTLSPI